MIWYGFLIFSISLLFFYRVFPYGTAVFNTPPRMFAKVLHDSAVVYSTQVSLLWALVNSSLLILIALFLAWYTRNKRKFLLFTIFAPWAVPLYLSAMSMRFAIYGIGGRSVISSLGLNVDILKDPLIAFFWTTVLNVWIHLPLVTLSFMAAFDQISKEKIEAAMIDGANDTEVLFNIALPEVSQVASGWFLLNLVRFFHSFTIPFVFADGGVLVNGWVTKWGGIGNLTTIGVLNYRVFSNTWDLGLVSAYSAVSILIISFLTLYWFFRENERRITLLSSFFSIFWFFLTGNWIDIAFALLVLFPFKQKMIKPFGALAVMCFSFFNSVPAAAYLIWALSFPKFKGKTFRLKKLHYLVEGSSYFLLVIALFLSLGMMISLFLTAFTDYPDTLKVTQITFEGFAKIFDDGYERYLGNSLFLSVPMALFLPILSIPLAHSMARKGERVLQFFILLQAASGFHVLIQLFIVYSKLSLLNSLFWIIPLASAGAVLQIVIVERGYIKNFPKELEELALIDGGKSVMRRMIFRYSLPAVFIGSLIGFMAGWNAFVGPLIFLFDESKYPVSVKLYDYVGNLRDKYPEWSSFGAAALINLIVVLTVFLINRWLSKKFRMVE